MNVAIVSCVHPPEPVVSSRTSADLARELHRRGHDVTMICPFPSRPAGKLYAGYRRSLRSVSIEEGVRTVRCFSTVSRRSTLVSRLAENITFGLSSAWALLRSPRADVLYVNTWPLFATALALMVARIRRVPVVLSIQDVYPESLVAQNRIRANGILSRMLRSMDALIVRTAAALIVLSERFAALYRDTRELEATRLHVIPNWLSGVSVEPLREEGLAYRRSRRIPDDAFLLVYGGNIGAAAGVEQIIEMFGRVRDNPRIWLLIAGEGSRDEACRQLAAAIDEGRILFQRPWPESQTAAVLSAADLLILPTQRSQAAVSVPSKLIAYMLSGRPIVATASLDSELAAVIEASGSGWVVPPERIDEFSQAVHEATAMSAVELLARGERARKYALEHFSRDRSVSRLIDILSEAAR